MGKNTLVFGAAISLAALIKVPAQAQPPERDFATYTPSVAPQRIAIADAPKIDGVLDDPVWQSATLISEFYQVDPTIETPPVETRVYLAFSEDALYVGVHAFDDEPDNIRALARSPELRERLACIDIRLQTLNLRLDRIRRRLEIACDYLPR